jgi:hypothetical protein
MNPLAIPSNSICWDNVPPVLISPWIVAGTVEVGLRYAYPATVQIFQIPRALTPDRRLYTDGVLNRSAPRKLPWLREPFVDKLPQPGGRAGTRDSLAWICAPYFAGARNAPAATGFSFQGHFRGCSRESQIRFGSPQEIVDDIGPQLSVRLAGDIREWRTWTWVLPGWIFTDGELCGLHAGKIIRHKMV